jgi:hypothetical protein
MCRKSIDLFNPPGSWLKKYIYSWRGWLALRLQGVSLPIQSYHSDGETYYSGTIFLFTNGVDDALVIGGRSHLILNLSLRSIVFIHFGVCSAGFFFKIVSSCVVMLLQVSAA